MYTPGTARAVADLHQLLVSMMPRRWSSVRLDVKRDDAGRFVHLTNLNAEIAPGGGAMPPNLGRDQGALVAEMNRALGTVAGDLGEAWKGLVARMDRAEDGSASLVLLAPDGSEQSRLTLAPDTVDSLVLGDALFDAFDATRQAAHAAQNAFQQTIQGFQRWDASQDTSELSFVLADGRHRAMRGQAIGSWSIEDGTWMWAWDNESVHPAFSADAARVRDLAKQQRGLAAMTTGKFTATQPLATELALHTAAIMGAQGVFPGPAGQVLIFIAAMK
ncbi:MAG TPA: hypothetical protein VIF09_23125 [Polyangiaceae bacterium]|jgi:hypothetical protein